MDNQITILCQMPLEKAVKDARVNNISLDHIKKMAKHLSLSSSKSRSALVNDIRKKHADVQTLKEILNARSLDSSDSEDDNRHSNDMGKVDCYYTPSYWRSQKQLNHL